MVVGYVVVCVGFDGFVVRRLDLLVVVDGVVNEGDEISGYDDIVGDMLFEEL